MSSNDYAVFGILGRLDEQHPVRCRERGIGDHGTQDGTIISVAVCSE
jgi:hypothetical protein